MTALWLYHAAFVLQLCSVALFAAYALRQRSALSVAASGVMAVAALLQCCFTAWLAVRDGGLPLGNGFEALNLWALLFTLLTLRLEWRYQMGLLGLFLSPFSALLLLMGFRFSQVLASTEVAASSWFFFSHVALAMAGYALFTASAGVAVAWFIEARQLKQGRLGFSFNLPSLDTLERLSARLAAWGLLGLSLSLLAGFTLNSTPLAVALQSDPKVLMSATTWSFYLGILLLRRGGFKGRRFAVLLLIGFVALFFAYYLVNIYLGGHEFSGLR